MTGPEKSERFLEPPPIEVAELVARHPDYNHVKRWQALGSDDAPTVREALGIAEQLRQNHIDPGDAFLQGLSYANAVDREKRARSAFIAEMGDHDADEIVDSETVETEAKTPSGRRPRRGIFRIVGAALLAHGRPTSRGGGVGV